MQISGNWQIYRNLRNLTLTDLQTLLVTAALKFVQILKAQKISVPQSYCIFVQTLYRLRINENPNANSLRTHPVFRFFMLHFYRSFAYNKNFVRNENYIIDFLINYEVIFPLFNNIHLLEKSFSLVRNCSSAEPEFSFDRKLKP